MAEDGLKPLLLRLTTLTKRIERRYGKNWAYEELADILRAMLDLVGKEKKT